MESGWQRYSASFLEGVRGQNARDGGSLDLGEEHLPEG